MSQRSNNRKCLICWIAAIGIEDDEKNLVFKTRQIKQCNFIAKRNFPQNTINVYPFCFWLPNRYILRKMRLFSEKAVVQRNMSLSKQDWNVSKYQKARQMSWLGICPIQYIPPLSNTYSILIDDHCIDATLRGKCLCVILKKSTEMEIVWINCWNNLRADMMKNSFPCQLRLS